MLTEACLADLAGGNLRQIADGNVDVAAPAVMGCGIDGQGAMVGLAANGAGGLVEGVHSDE